MLIESSLVLVAYLPAPRDFEIARLLGWYRIPLRTAPKVVSVDYLAFYQPASFGERGGRIEYVAEVRGHELTTRRALLRDEQDHPRAHEEYYKIQIGPLEKLPHPVLAGKWRRVTFLYTTGAYLLNASSLHDLVIRDGERAMLWKALRERSQQPGAYHTEDSDIPPEILDMLIGWQAGNEAH